MDMRTSPGSAAADAFDPVTLEIFWSRLISIADEAAVGLLRTAFSTIVREFERLRHRADGPRRQLGLGEHRRHRVVLLHPAAHHQDVSRALSGRDLAAGRLRDHQRSLARHRPPPGLHLRQPDLSPRRAGRLRRLDRAFPRRRRRAVVGRLPRAVRGGHSHPARALPARGRAQRRADRAHPRQRAGAAPGARRFRGAGDGERSLRPAGRGIPRTTSVSPTCSCSPARCTPGPTSPCAAPSRRFPTAPTGRRSRPTASTSSSPASPARSPSPATPCISITPGPRRRSIAGSIAFSTTRMPIRSIRSNARSIRSRRATKAPIGPSRWRRRNAASSTPSSRRRSARAS